VVCCVKGDGLGSAKYVELLDQLSEYCAPWSYIAFIHNTFMVVAVTANVGTLLEELYSDRKLHILLH
jgi:hypothetical protein